MVGIVDKITEVTIYESPDGGETVYARKSGSKERELIKEASKYKRLFYLDEFYEMEEFSKNNLAIRDKLEELKVLYELSKKDSY